MPVAKYLAIDLGAESGRAIVGIVEDEIISLEEVHRFPSKQIKNSSGYFWDTNFLFGEILKSIELAVGFGHSDIESIGIDTWGVDFGLIGFDGKLIELPRTYRDPRTEGIPDMVFNIINSEELYRRTGIQTMQINSLFQLYSLKLTNQSILKETNKLLFMPDLFNYLLTGKLFSEYTIASTSQLLNVYKKSFDEKIFSALDLPVNIMSPIVKSGTVIGKILPNLCSEIGIKEIDVVAVASHDTASAVCAVPSINKNFAFLSSGTWSLLGIESDQPIINSSYQNYFTNEGGINNTIRYLNNTSGFWIIQQLIKKLNKERVIISFDEIVELASKEFSKQPIIDLNDNMFLNPEDMVEAINNYCIKHGLAVPQNYGSYARLIFENLAWKYNCVIKNLENATGLKIDTLHIVGGGSRNNLVNNLTAEVTGKQVIAGPVEATACGNILIQALAKGRISTITEIRKIVANSFPVKIFNPVG